MQFDNYKEIVEFSPLGIFQIDLNGIFQAVNNSFTALLGYTKKEDILGKNLSDIFFDILAEKEVLSIRTRQEESSFEVRLKKADNEPLWVQINFKSIGSSEDSGAYILGFVADIDYKKKIKISLTEVSTRFHATLANNKIGLWDWDLKSDLLNVSQVWKNQLGHTYERSTVTFEEWKELIHPDDRQETISKLQDYITGRIPAYETEYRMKHNNGKYIWIFDRANLVKNEDGSPDRILGTHLDISDRKQIEKELAVSRIRFDQFFNSSPVAFCVVNKNFEYLKINNAMAGYMGIAARDLIGKKIKDVFPGNHIAIESILRRVVQENNFFVDVESFTGNSGQDIHALATYFSLPDEEAGIILLDISNTINARKALEVSENKFRTIYELSPLGIAILDSEGCYRRANNAFQTLTGYPEEDLKRMTFRDITFNEDLDESDLFFNRLANGDLDNYHLEKRFIKKDGGIIWTNSMVSVFYDSNEKGLRIINMVQDITGKKAAELRLKENEKYYRALFENSSDLKIIVDKDGKITYWSKAVENILGFGRDDLFGKTISKYITQNEYLSILGFIGRKKSKPGVAYPFEVNLKDKNGDLHYMEGLANNLINDEIIQGIIINLRDVTEKKIAEMAISESEEKFRQLAENINDVFYIVSPDFKTLYYASPLIESIWGIEPGQLYTSPEIMIESVHPDYRTRFKELFYHLPSNGKFDYEHKILNHNGSVRWIRTRAFPIRNSDGEVNKIAGVSEDISDKKYWQDQVLKLSKAVEHSPVIIMVTNVEGSLEYVNPKFTEVTGYNAAEVLGKKPGIVSSKKKNKSDYKIIWDTILSGKEWQGEFENIKKNGDHYWVYASISPIIDDNGEISNFVAVEEDITNWKYYEKELIKAKESAENSDRLKSIFLAQMSHEIRTPLNNILTYTSLLEEELEDKLPVGLESTFSIIGSSAKRLMRTIELILNLSRIQTGNFEFEYKQLDLDNDILFDIILEFSLRAREKDLVLHYDCPADKRVIIGDPYTLGQIFVNLLDNSIKYSHKGEINAVLYNEDNKVCVDISDCGIGISNEFLPKLFDPFTQEDSSSTRNYEGTGLGLTLVKNYADINKASLSVRSEKGKGTTFTVKFDPAE